jgi:hypothetical protein
MFWDPLPVVGGTDTVPCEGVPGRLVGVIDVRAGSQPSTLDQSSPGRPERSTEFFEVRA